MLLAGRPIDGLVEAGGRVALDLQTAAAFQRADLDIARRHCRRVGLLVAGPLIAAALPPGPGAQVTRRHG